MNLMAELMHGLHNNFVAQNHVVRGQADMVNIFETEVIDKFWLEPQLYVDGNNKIQMIAHVPKLCNAEKEIDDLKAAGFEIGDAKKLDVVSKLHTHWQCPVKKDNLRFTLQFSTEVDVC